MSKLNRMLLIVGLLLSVTACNKEVNTSSKTEISLSSSSSQSSTARDDFSDLEKKKDESCDTTEDLEKKIEEKAKKQEAFKLQGGDPGCTTD